MREGVIWWQMYQPGTVMEEQGEVLKREGIDGGQGAGHL